MSINHISNSTAARTADYLAHVSDQQLAAFAADVLTGRPLEKYIIAGTVEQLLRALSYSTIIKELQRRAEVAELEETDAR